MLQCVAAWILREQTARERERGREREREGEGERWTEVEGRWRKGGGASSHRKMLTCAVARYLSGSVRSAERGRIHCCCGGMRQSVSVTLMPGILFRLRRCRERSNDLKTGFAYECTGAASPSKRESSLAAVVDRRELLGCHRRREFPSPVSLQILRSARSPWAWARLSSQRRPPGVPLPTAFRMVRTRGPAERR